MSAGDVVCTGWLIKSPPEKKLKRFAWRKRWFVLRRGRMSGNPDVLEYYQSKNSKKPIRTIDLKECEVEMLNGQLRIKRDFNGKHLFVVKTTFRVFYLVAKTEEEMNSWISQISQISQFGSLEDAESSEEGFPHTPTSLHPSPDGSDRVSVSSQPDSSHPLDYLFLSQCETGSVSTIRHDSFSNSEISLEQRSSDDAFKDAVPSPIPLSHTDSSSSSIFQASPSPSLFLGGRLTNPPFSDPCSSMALPSSSSSPLRHGATSVFRFDKPYSSAVFEATIERQTPPPLPPKSNHLSEQISEEAAHLMRTSARHFPNHATLFPRRTSLSGLDHFRIGDAENRLMKNRRQSLNLQHGLNSTRFQSFQDESYVPMASPSPSVAPTESDGYIPMSPSTFSLLNSNCSAESSTTIGPLMCPPGDFVPPPIHRHLKPRLRRARPPPLDLRGLSTITECPTHLPLSRAMTEACFSVKCLPLERRLENGENPTDEDTNCTTMDPRQHFSHSFDGVRRSNLDYLSLDFNSASPSPVLKQKPLLCDEYRVDYVQVDEKKTQALQNTKMEWTDVRQSKT
ncbi:GRB2-associated-binding protein 3 isoform X1 [Pseudochaenichthys georgianus]|uniref:GRB2-associated-binding protein 3 isoform X1 n=1 Tax=Pseudochaenichthys georgianus TaxID=52239 RepID=UPI00146C440B|nr:GRB2-associated-binding protein 3 isoform X1 [Pseudochaenichthys georgianus]XP_033955672.1 GRB2-associated-binding protein 3 isoform X1 [Pseudochaenichthys georgianus]